jgi:hypothetical protein
MMDTPVLQPCPFCGSIRVSVEGFYSAAVECLECSAEGSNFGGQVSRIDPIEAIQKAIKAWNRVANVGSALPHSVFSFSESGKPCTAWSSGEHIVAENGECRCGKHSSLY